VRALRKKNISNKSWATTAGLTSGAEFSITLVRDLLTCALGHILRNQNATKDVWLEVRVETANRFDGLNDTDRNISVFSPSPLPFHWRDVRNGLKTHFAPIKNPAPTLPCEYEDRLTWKQRAFERPSLSKGNGRALIKIFRLQNARWESNRQSAGSEVRSPGVTTPDATTPQGRPRRRNPTHTFDSVRRHERIIRAYMGARGQNAVERLTDGRYNADGWIMFT